jgi:hypothetical protein
MRQRGRRRTVEKEISRERVVKRRVQDSRVQEFKRVQGLMRERERELKRERES